MPLAPDERRARGKAARQLAGRRSHGEWSPGEGRPDPVDLLEGQARSRLPDLVPIRYGRMLESPFAFYRGAAVIMAADLATLPATGLRAQLCGDAHLSNFGQFGTPERRVAFDLSDFDETYPGPFEWDVKRLAASVAIAGRALGLDHRRRARAVRRTVASYRTAMARFAGETNLAVWYAHRETGGGTRRARQSQRALDRLVDTTGEEPRLRSDPPLVVPLEELEPAGVRRRAAASVQSTLRDYRASLLPDRRHLIDQYRLVHVARKVVGVGSVGTRTWIALLVGRDAQDRLILQVKEAQPSVLAPYAGRHGYDDEAQRVVAGQRLMQAASDAFLGWKREERRHLDFYVRQLHDWKASVDVERMEPRELARYGEKCGWTLARAHARTGDRIAIAAYLGRGDGFDHALAAFAEAYADQNERDLAALEAAADCGRVVALRGV